MSLPPIDPVIHKDLHPIIVACNDGDTKTVKRYLDEGVSVYVDHKNHVSLAATAISGGYADILNLLLEHGYNPNHAEGSLGYRPLHHIIGSPNQIEMAMLLLEAGANPNIENKYGVTPLMGAAGSGNLEYLELLMRYGADVRREAHNLHTPFYFAAAAGQAACAERLLALGGDVNAVDNRNKTALHWAAQRGNLKAVQWLLAHKADKKLIDDFDYTALDWAKENGHEEVVRVLS